MRLPHALAAGLTAATTIASAATGLAAPAYAVSPAHSARPRAAYAAQSAARAGRAPSCGKQSDPDFPLKARIHGGPAAYRAGGGAHSWYLDLTNTTRHACRDIHPVLVLTDSDRTLAAARVRLELADSNGRWRTLPLETSEESEIIGVLDDGSPGFSVPAGKKVTVRARLHFTAAAHPGTIVIRAATVQRRGKDGDWVGESNAYRFAVLGKGAVRERDSGDADQGDVENWETGSGRVGSGDVERGDHGRDSGGGGTGGGGTGGGTGGSRTGGADGGTTGLRPGGRDKDPRVPLAPRPAGSRDAAGHGETPGVASPSPDSSAEAPTSPSADPMSPELAGTGSGHLLEWTAAVAALLAAGSALTLWFRRLRI
ncbi:hypothetical protein [Streptomyces sp. NPDC088725]|uniref:hypothetical protein n=1 Tax=Streptomyces sp. NPDC088725 TaxID=3365873 RepID=UPI003829E3A4